MKFRFRRLLMTGLIAFGAVAGAYAQSDLNADVPFAFTTPAGGEMPSGPYTISQINSISPVPMYRLRHRSTGKSVIALAPELLAPSGKTAPELRFRCANETCAISGLYRSGSENGHGFQVKLKPVAPATDIAEIRIPLGE